MTEATSSVPGWEQRSLAEIALRAADRDRGQQLSAPRAIVQAGMDLLEETGGFAFTVKQVSERAGVALMTLYRYFVTKDQLILAVIEEVNSRGSATFRDQARSLSDPYERLRSVIMQPLLTVAAADTPPFVRSVIREHLRLQETFPREAEQLHAPYRALVREALDAAADAGRLVPVDLAFDADIVVHLVATFAHRLALASTDPHEQDLADYLWDFLWAALNRAAR